MGWANGTVLELPKKLPKKRKPLRYGIAYLARRIDGAWLLERRPEAGLLGGMLGWPGTPWTQDSPLADPPIRAEWKTMPEQARHSFTHFNLQLEIHTALVPMDREPIRGQFVPKDRFSQSDLPTVMRKAFELCNLG